MKILSLLLSIVMFMGCDKSKSQSPDQPKPNAENPGTNPELNGSQPENRPNESGQLTESGSKSFAVVIGPTKWAGSINSQKQIALTDLPSEYAIELAGIDESQTIELNKKYQQQCTNLTGESAPASSLVQNVRLRLENYPRDSEVLEGIRYQVRKSMEQTDLSIAAPMLPSNRNLNFDTSARSSAEGKLNDAFISWSQKGATLAVLAYHGSAVTNLPLGTLCDIVEHKISMNLEWK